MKKKNYNKKRFVAAKYHELAREMRGSYLNSVAVLETEMAEIITGYFCKEDYRKDLFFSEVATGQILSFSVKITMIGCCFESNV